jgi:hypothetical protein
MGKVERQDRAMGFHTRIPVGVTRQISGSVIPIANYYRVFASPLDEAGFSPLDGPIAPGIRPRRRFPKPGPSEQAFLNELETRDLPVGNFNLPDWEDRKDGLHGCLSSLFQVTPPTALICEESLIFVAALQFLARWRLRVPGDVSLVSSDANPTLGRAFPRPTSTGTLNPWQAAS